MDDAVTEFVRRGCEANDKLVSLMAGAPGLETLRGCKEILLKATSDVLEQEEGLTSALGYGDDMGHLTFRDMLATFLSQEYGDTVLSTNLMVTAGATQALHMVATILLHKDCVVFIEEPTYFSVIKILKDDFQLKMVPVSCDADGMDTDLLDRLLTAHRPENTELSSRYPFWGMVYTIPVFNNPTGRCYSADRCRKMVELARKHDILLMAEDVYNLIHFGSSPPARLLSYDKPSDPDYKGHTLSSGTFSKILAPGLRLGWLEGPDRILSPIHGSNMIWSGGNPNHFASLVAGAAIRRGLQSQHLRDVRQIYAKRCDAVCKILKDNLPPGATFMQPKGGFFVWVEFAKGTDTFSMMKWMVEKYKMFFLPGICASAVGQYGHCARLSICSLKEPLLLDSFSTFCKAATEYINQCSAH